jgi:transcriptional regulator with XRE-family HTH domain
MRESPQKTKEKKRRQAFGARLQAARQARGLTQSEVAEKAGLSNKFLSRVESGHATPSVLVAAAIAEALGTSLDALVDVRAKPENPRITALLALLRDRSNAELDQAERLLGALFRAR